MSRIAFGTYRISEHNPLHLQALKDALYAGVELIDTSTNYLDGGAEKAIALALRELDETLCENIKIVSKFGYIQGSNLQRHKQRAFEEVIEYTQECYHSIAKSFMHDQLTQSLERLERENIDCYLVHNPEYYLFDAIKKGIQKDSRLDEIYNRLFKVFIGLEEEVQNGRINSYGVSSNSFSLPNNSEEFLPYEDLLELAQKAADSLGIQKHNFTTIELPINLLEQEGLKCAKWAKENGLRLLVNRPLNAQKEKLMYRLADYAESREYYHYLNEILELCDNEILRPLFNLIEQLDDNKHKFGWIGDYEAFLFTQILPHIKNTLQKLEPQSQEALLQAIELFLQEYKKMVSYECAKHTKTALKEELKNSKGSMQEYALEFLLAKESIDYVLVGMRKSSYVYEMLEVENKSL